MASKTNNEAIRIAVENKKLLQRIEKNLHLKKYLKMLRKHLDFGCGFGFFTQALSERYPNLQIDGLDKDKKKIENAEVYRKTKSVNYICSEKIKGKYDAVSAKLVLHEVKNLNKLLGEIYRSLNTDGKIIVYDFRRVSKKDFKKLFDKWEDKRYGFEKQYSEHNKWSLKEFEEIMRKAGFRKIKSLKDGDYFLMYLGEKDGK